MSPDFSVVAIISAYNEADIIEQVVDDLVTQGVQIYLLDDGSTDGTAAAVERHVGRGVIGIERLAPAAFDWERILVRKAQLAAELDASWFIHHDADEFRESPWPNLSLREAIRRVDALGYNAIDFAGLDFWPTAQAVAQGADIRRALTMYSELAPYDRVQIRCWKKTAIVDLAASGGHEAQFPERRVFPIRFILRHYPIRGQAHGERKVFAERRNRFLTGERERGWHVQYDHLHEGASFIKDASTLTPFDADATRIALSLRHRGVEELEHALESARREITTLQAEQTRLNTELARRAEEVTQLGAHISWLGAENIRRDDEIARRDAAMAWLGTENARRDAEIAARDAEVAGLRGNLAHRGAEIAELQASMRGIIEAHQVEKTALVDALEQRTIETERWRTGVEGLSRQLEDVQRSLSWRWTSPIRAAYRLLARGRS
jgi:hypothetical protein